MELTSRERICLALQHKEADRVPFSLGFSFNRPALEDFQHYMKIPTYEQAIDYIEELNDLKWLIVPYTANNSRMCTIGDTQYDEWGVGRRFVSYGRGCYDEIFEYPLKNINTVKDLNSYEWPKTEWFDFTQIKDIIKKTNKKSKNKNEYCFRFSAGTLFEHSWYLRGFENFFMDLVTEPDYANEVLKRVTDFFIDFSIKTLQAADGLVDIAFVGDDLAGQEGLLMSPELYKNMIKPHHKRLYDTLKQFDVKLMYHSDGAIHHLVPELMDAGIDILEALQFDAKGMDPEMLKNNYGDRLSFHGGISVQSTLPFKKPQDVIDEVNERFRVLGKNGGYILAPSHAIQTGTPPENVNALFESAMKCVYK